MNCPSPPLHLLIFPSLIPFPVTYHSSSKHTQYSQVKWNKQTKSTHTSIPLITSHLTLHPKHTQHDQMSDMTANRKKRKKVYSSHHPWPLGDDIPRQKKRKIVNDITHQHKHLSYIASHQHTHIQRKQIKILSFMIYTSKNTKYKKKITVTTLKCSKHNHNQEQQ